MFGVASGSKPMHLNSSSVVWCGTICSKSACADAKFVQTASVRLSSVGNKDLQPVANTTKARNEILRYNIFIGGLSSQVKDQFQLCGCFHYTLCRMNVESA